MIVEERIPTTDRGETVLVCPRCCGESLHHQAVTSYDRGEDAELVIRSVLEDGSAKIEAVSSDRNGNPSSRRDGLSIKFWCEGCKGVDEDTLELTVAQHKGSTLLGWRYSAKAPPD